MMMMLMIMGSNVIHAPTDWVDLSQFLKQVQSKANELFVSIFFVCLLFVAWNMVEPLILTINLFFGISVGLEKHPQKNKLKNLKTFKFTCPASLCATLCFFLGRFGIGVL